MDQVTDKAGSLPWDTIEVKAQKQILNTASMPFVFKHVAVMPDCRYGKGATVGTVLPTAGAIVPAAVGVDIGCGMIAVRTPLKRTTSPDAAAIRAGIERRIPMSAGKFNVMVTESAAKRITELETLAHAERGIRISTTRAGDSHAWRWHPFIELADDTGARCGPLCTLVRAESATVRSRSHSAKRWRTASGWPTG